MIRALALSLTLMIPVVATAEGRAVRSDHATWQVTVNEHGAILDRPGERIYMGRGCDAISTVSGGGRWAHDNAGFRIYLPGRTVFFARQDHPLPRPGCFDR